MWSLTPRLESVRCSGDLCVLLAPLKQCSLRRWQWSSDGDSKVLITDLYVPAPESMRVLLAEIQDPEGFPCDFDASKGVLGLLRVLDQKDVAGPHSPAVRGIPLDRLPERRVCDLIIAQFVHGVHTVFQVDQWKPGAGEAYWLLICCRRIEMEDRGSG